MPLFGSTVPSSGNYQLGANYRPGSIKLRFRDYLRVAKLPVIPKEFGHISNTPPGGSWGMLGNDQAGDCVMAGYMHEDMLIASATGKPLPLFNTPTALSNYSAALVADGGAPYDPNNPSTDTGLDVQAAASWRRNIGVTDANGVVHRIDSYLMVDSLEHVIIAAYLGGACGLALNLPQSAGDQFDKGEVWDDLTSPTAGGHYVPLFGRNSKGINVVCTWGALQGATDAYLNKFLQTGVAYVNLDYMLATGKTPEAIDLATLKADLASIAATA